MGTSPLTAEAGRGCATQASPKLMRDSPALHETGEAFPLYPNHFLKNASTAARMACVSSCPTPDSLRNASRSGASA